MLRRIIPVLAVVLLVAGCTGDPAQPAPITTARPTSTQPTTTTTTSATTRPTVAPAVTNPVDLTQARKHPCATLTAAQQRRLELPPRVGEAVEGSHGLCHWTKEDAGLVENDYVLLLHVSPDLLAEAYKSSNSREDGEPAWVLFEPRVVDGLPAVVRSFSARADFCEVIVGAGKGQAIRMSGRVHEPDPGLCDRLVTAAGQVVTSVRR